MHNSLVESKEQLWEIKNVSRNVSRVELGTVKNVRIEKKPAFDAEGKKKQMEDFEEGNNLKSGWTDRGNQDHFLNTV